jgi:hypothetical protein
MVQGIFILIFLSFISYLLISRFKSAFPRIDGSLLQPLLWYHWLFGLIYYLYVLSNPTDSRAYYKKVTIFFRGDTWGDFYGTSTTFIEWLGYPFIHYFGFTYESMMVLFSFFGFIGFLFIFYFFKERINTRINYNGFDLITLLLFLPNMHFWSNSFGKGSIIFMGIGMFFFALNKLKSRWIFLILGGVIVYHVRPHVLLVFLVSILIGAAFSSKGVSPIIRFLVLGGGLIVLFFIYQDVLKLIGVEQEDLLSGNLDFSTRGDRLSSAGSGIDISSYNLPFQVFTFLYRPLFIDIPSAFGFFVSIENLFYLVLTWQFVFKGGIRFLLRGDFITKTAFLSFITVSIALAQISGNLGLAIRQKSQVMMLFMFVIAYFFQERQQKSRGQRLRRPRQVPEPGGVPS